MEPNKESETKRSKQKKKVKYNILLVPDTATADVKKFSVRLSVITSIMTAIILIIALLIIYCYYLSNHIVTLNSSLISMRNQVVTMNEEKNQLIATNEELQEKILILSDTVNEKLQAEEEREAEIAKEFMPSGFPMSGTASFDEDTTDAQGNPIVTFLGGEGTDIVAAGKGVVASITGNSDDGYTVIIDHQNGYNSIYINSTEPKVKEGDEVTKETVIYSLGRGHEKLGYQITKDGKYINPMDVMEVYG